MVGAQWKEDIFAFVPHQDSERFLAIVFVIAPDRANVTYRRLRLRFSQADLHGSSRGDQRKA